MNLYKGHKTTVLYTKLVHHQKFFKKVFNPDIQGVRLDELRFN